MSVRKIEEKSNLRQGQIKKVLKLLSVENPAPVVKVNNQWRRTPVRYAMDHERIVHLTGQRECEWAEMQAYVAETGCKMTFLLNALDDDDPTPCGRCESCTATSVSRLPVDSKLAHSAATYLKHAEMVIKPKAQVAANSFQEYGFQGNLPQDLRAQEGRVLSRWGDAGWGGIVADHKHSGRFSDELVEAMAQMIHKRWEPSPAPQWVCCIPSRNHPELVPDFAIRLAALLEIPFVDVVKKVKDNHPQKQQQNRYHQCQNLDGVFAIHQKPLDTPVLLIDDVVDSGWTLTVIAALLQQAGSGVVYPAALATSSVKDS